MNNVFRQFVIGIAMLGAVTVLPLCNGSRATAAMTDYCTVPPFVQTTVTPNVMILIDFSGSMQFPAYLGCNFQGYTNSTAQCSATSTPLTGTDYDASATYYGYFATKDADNHPVYYKYGTSYFTAVDSTECTTYRSSNNNIGGANCISGNLLNWATATRVDVARRVMTGGRTGGSGTGTYLDSEGSDYKYQDNNLYCVFQISHSSTSTPATRRLTITSTTGHTCAVGTLSNTEVQVLKDPSSIFGVVDDFYNKVVFDFMYFNSDNKGVIPTGGIKGAALTDLKSAVNTQLPYNGTPTGEALWEVYDFFQQYNGHSYVNNSGATAKGTCAKDPFFDCSGSSSVAMPCRKSFVLMLSDGAFNGDVDPVVPARHLRKDDLRSDTGLASSQYVAVYPIFTFGDLDPGYKAQGKVSLITTAIFGGYLGYGTDSFPYPFTGYSEGLTTDCGSTYDSSARSNIVDGTSTWCNSRAVNNGTLASASYFHSKCNPAGTTSATYNEKCKGWDPQKTGFPYNFFSASNGTELENAVINALSDMVAKVSSGTAASVLASSEGSGANILQAIFFPKRNIGPTEILWTGQMQNLWYYIDPKLAGSAILEDTSGDKKLNLSNDDVIAFRFDTTENQVVVDKSTYAGASVGVGYGFDQVNNLWEVGSLLFSRTDARTIYTTLDGADFTDFSASTAGSSITFRGFLRAADAAEATKIVNYVAGTDQTGYRGRTVTINGTAGVWKLGDIIDSTPRAQTSSPLNTYHLASPNGYSDASYKAFINTTTGTAPYKSRGMAYVGANDGMLHAFNMGVLLEHWPGQDSTIEKAYLSGSNLGREQWAFIPKNALPYLKYMTDANYCHLYYVDTPVFLLDASVGAKGDGDISGNDKPADGSTWRTILIGGMGLGGACKALTACGTSDCVQSPLTGAGLSSYFAIDVTNPSSPVLLWEFSDENLGFSTSGPAIVKLGKGTKNGKWFVIFASGPTGAVDTAYHQFMGRSDQSLKLFILDLKSGVPYQFAGKKYYDTGIDNAFGGSLYNSFIDVQKGETNAADTGNYQDDVLYLGYTSKCAGTEPSGTPCTTGTWTNGGVLRILTNENTDPGQWTIHALIENVGPVTTAVTKLQDRGQKGSTPALWLYFGTGRFYYKRGSELDEDGSTVQRKLFGVTDSCYGQDSAGHAYMTSGCVLGSTIGSGWPVSLDQAMSTTDGTFAAERVITDPIATFSGNVFFTTFAPSADPCKMGGNSYLWALWYNNAGVPKFQAGAKALIQVSTGEIKQMELSSVFTDKGGKRTTSFIGVPPKGQGLSVLVPPRPTRRVLHIQEK